MNVLTATAVEMAISQLHVREKGGQNRGPEIEQYQYAAGGGPGEPWCCSGLYWCFDRAAKLCGMVNPFPRTRSSLSLWKFAEPVCRDSNPGAGYVYVLQHGPHTGHCGIVERVDPDGVIWEISFNTFADQGSREGNAVARHIGQPEAVHGGVLLGYLNFALAAQPATILTS